MKIERDGLVTKLEELKKQGMDYLVKITAVDYAKSITAIYFVRNVESDAEEVLEVELDPNDAWLPTVLHVHAAADWYERELYEMFGIGIRGREVKKLLLEKWEGTEFPLRKSFEWNTHATPI